MLEFTETEEMAGGWRRLRNGELNNLYTSPIIIRVIKSKMRWVGNVARMEARDSELYYENMKSPLGRPRRRGTVWEGVGWIHLAQDGAHWRAVSNMVIDLVVV